MKTDIQEALTSAELTAFTDQESIIEEGRETFVLVGRALTKIRDGRLYRQSHKSFDEYCRARWGYEKSRAYQLIAAAEVVGELSGKSENSLQIVDVQNEGQVRELAKAPKGKRSAVMEAAEKSAQAAGKKRPTAKDIKAEVQKVTATPVKPDPAPPADSPSPKKPKNGAEVWPAKDRKVCHEAFGKFMRIIDKSPIWSDVRGHCDAIAKALNPPSI